MNKIKKIRLEKKLTQKELAGMLNVHQTAVSQWEKDRTTPDIDALNKMSIIFNTTINDILGNNVPTDKQINDSDIKFALFGDKEIDDKVLDEVKRFAKFAKEDYDKKGK